MKIGIVLPAAPGYSETFFTNKIKGLQANGHEVVLFVNTSKGQSDFICEIKKAPSLSGNALNVFWVSLFCLIKTWLLHFGATYRLFKNNKKDGLSFGSCLKNSITNSHILSESLDWLHFGFGTMAIGRENVAKSIGAKMAVSFRGFDIGIYPVKNPNCYRLLWQKVDKIHVISDDIKELVYKHGFSGEAPIVKITPAINTDYFKSDTIDSNNDSLQLMTVARLNWKKGLEYTFEALAILKQQKIAFHYTIIGDGNEKERLVFAVHQLGLKENVTFAGKLSPEEVKAQLQSADLYLQYSIQEGFCNAVLEAQAMGKICVVSDAEGLRENVVDGITGFVVPKRKPLSLANKIVEVVRLSETEKNKLRQKAIERMKTHFTIEKQIEEFNDFYEII
ncbi:glycosyltransferase family 4 protein [Flavobacterium adhaerens]|uniref:glycosyltransferase family 4 protein n=1 Tax=Flavobacterium adhaerens TaxID=3149043 RepID=UPI0032B3ECB9